jgi:ABC-2 type transport system permease protein
MKTLLRLTRVELLLFLREPLTALFTLVLPLFILFIMGGVFGNTPDPSGEVYRGVGAMDYYVPAYIGLAIASMGLVGLPVHLAGYRELGVLRRFRASSVGLGSVLGSQALVTLVMAGAGSIALAGAGALAYDIQAPQQPGGFVVAALLVGVMFAAVGVLLGSLLPTARAAQGAGVLLWFTMLMLGGAGPPLEVLPTSLRTVAEVTPLKHSAVLLQDLWFGWGWNAGAFAVVLGILAVCTAVSFRFFRWE